MSWAVRAVPLPAGDRAVDLWVDATGCLITEPTEPTEPTGSAEAIRDAERLPGRYVLPGLVDAHAHPTVGVEAGLPVAVDGSAARNTLAAWAAAGVCLVRDAGSPGGSVLQLDLDPGMPRLQAAGRFLAPPGRYYPALLPEGVPQDQLTELALGELARGGRWVKLIADFPAVTDGTPSGPADLTYSAEAITAMVAAVHAAGGRVAAHAMTDFAADLVRAGVDSIEHGTEIDETVLPLMAASGTAWTPTLCAVLGLPDTASDAARERIKERRQRLSELLPLAHRLGVPILTGTDLAGTLPQEVALLAGHGLGPVAALEAATTTGYQFFGEPVDQPRQLATLVTYQDDPREDLAVLSSPCAVIIDGVRVR